MDDGVRLEQNGIAGYQRISIVINWCDAEYGFEQKLGVQSQGVKDSHRFKKIVRKA